MIRSQSGDDVVLNSGQGVGFVNQEQVAGVVVPFERETVGGHDLGSGRADWLRSECRKDIGFIAGVK